MIPIRFIFILTFLSLLSSCTQKKRYTVLIENASGLQIGSEVVFNGSIIGRVSKMKILPDLRIILSLSVKNGFDIPNGSKFLVNSPLIGSNRLLLEKSQDSSFASKHDTLYAYLDTVKHPSLLSDTTKRKALNKIVEGFKELIESTDKDTIK